MDSLKPCPFCGPEHADSISHNTNNVCCRRCGCTEWLVDWQARPIEDALQAKLDTARGWLVLVDGAREYEGEQTWRLDELREILGGNHD